MTNCVFKYIKIFFKKNNKLANNFPFSVQKFKKKK